MPFKYNPITNQLDITGSSGGGGGITTIDVDNSGSVTGSTISLFANSGGANTGSSVKFIAHSATQIDLNLTDSNANTILGSAAGNSTISGAQNTGLGYVTLTSLTSGAYNTSVGASSLLSLLSGTYNVCVGYAAGSQYQSSESHNSLINALGFGGDSNVIRIQDTTSIAGQATSCYIGGINNSSSSGFNTPLPVYVDSSTGQLGYGSAGGSVTITGDTGSISGSSLTIFANTAAQNCGSSVQFVNSGTTSQLNITDSLQNQIVGQNSGNYPITGQQNTSFGPYNLIGLTTGTGNTVIGNSTLGSGFFQTGNYNTVLGFYCGSNYTSSESYNILIGSMMTAVTGESNVIRIGDSTSSSPATTCYIGGISGATPITGQAVGVASTGQLTGGGVLTNPAQPAFLVQLNVGSTNVTGDGTTYTLVFDTTTLDQGSNFNAGTGTFTAPVTGVYYFAVSAQCVGIAGQTGGFMQINTTSRSFTGTVINPSAAQDATDLDFQVNTVTPMTAGDICVFTITLSGGAKTVGMGGGLTATYARGFLIC